MLQPWMQALRSVVRRPGFAISAVVILAAGIGATTGVFSIVDAALFKPLPYPEPDRLVRVLEANTSKTEAAGLIAPGRLEDWNRLNRTFESIAGSYGENLTETSGENPERLAARRVSPRYFSVFNVRAAIGRTFVAEEDASGGPDAVVISDGLWARRFQRRADIVSQRLTFAGRSHAIVGVMPASFSGRDVELWIPAKIAPFLMQLRDARFVTGIGRLKAGITVVAAQRDLARVQKQLGEQFPATDRDWSAQVDDLKNIRVGQFREPLTFILASVVLLLVIALANIAGLMLTQLQSRAGELAIRNFLGASRLRVVFGVVQEVLVIVVAAIAVAIVLDVVVLKFASTKLTSIPGADTLAIDWRALFVASMCGAAAAVVCGAIPALRATRMSGASKLSRSGRGFSSNTRSQRILVGGQIAIATLLLSSTGLMLRSYYNLANVDSGFDASRTATFHVGAGWAENRVKVGQMQQQILAALANIPSVTAAGFSNFLPASNATLRYQLQMQGSGSTDNASSAARDQITVGSRSVTSGYFAAIGARMIAGATCPDLATLNRESPKLLVNRRFATLHGDGQSVVGRYAKMLGGGSTASMEIIGVVDDIREDNLRNSAVPFAYSCLGAGDWPDPEYVVRTSGDPRAILPAIRKTIRDIAPTRAVFGSMPLQQNIDASIGQTRLQTQLIAAFGFIAVMLAMVGLYGLVALAVTTRRREIGIRIALGAEPARMVRELALRVVSIVAIGACAGLAMTAIAQRGLRALVFGVAPLDPLTLISATSALVVISVIATVIPALRAARIDPAGAMRE